MAIGQVLKLWGKKYWNPLKVAKYLEQDFFNPGCNFIASYTDDLFEHSSNTHIKENQNCHIIAK